MNVIEKRERKRGAWNQNKSGVVTHPVKETFNTKTFCPPVSRVSSVYTQAGEVGRKKRKKKKNFCPYLF